MGRGFPARLLGAFVFGHFGDKTGRKYSFLINILIVGVTTCLTARCPDTRPWGSRPRFCWCFCGCSRESGSGASLAALRRCWPSLARKRKSRAFWMSLANLGIPLGAMSASAVMLVLNKSFTTTGWRVAMLLSALIVAPGAAGSL